MSQKFQQHLLILEPDTFATAKGCCMFSISNVD